MKPVLQLERTGCGIARVAAITGQSFAQAETMARALDISASDSKLWSDTQHVRRLLKHYGVQAAARETPFRTWQALPDLALPAIKWHRDLGVPLWH